MEGYFIKQGNIGLRQIELSDRDAFIKWHNDNRMREKIGVIFPFNNNVFMEICHTSCVAYPANIWFAGCEYDQLIGIAGLHSIKYIQKNAEIAVFIGDEINRGKGIGKVVLHLIEQYAFGILNLHRLYALIYSNNDGALGFFKSCGWKREGLLKDAAFWNHHFRDVIVYAALYQE